MSKISTEAWVLNDGNKDETWETLFRKEVISFDPLTANEVLVETIFGGWESNMTHALNRKPLDLCKRRGEAKIVLGNSAVVRVLDIHPTVTTVKKGDICAFISMGKNNRLGFLDSSFAFGYDEPGSMGFLAKQTKVLEKQLFTVPPDSHVPLHQWPSISVRFGTAWSNWKVASKCWHALVPPEDYPSPYVFGWGGGVALGELLLAKEQGFKVAMITSTDERLEMIEKLGIIPVDRRLFPDLYYDHARYEAERDFRKKYLASLHTFRKIVADITGGEDVSIFVDNIGLPVYPATLRVLARPGVITTSGWKHGMELELNRAYECHHRHIHVFTHGMQLLEGIECVAYAAKNNWIPADDTPIYGWDDIPQLAHDYANDKINSYFPTFQVNPI